MIPVYTTEESGRLDRAAADPVPVLMERAGWAVADAVIELGAGYGTRVSVLAGPGNNGGDGWSAASRLAARGCRVTVHSLAQPRTEASRFARDQALRSGVSVGAIERPSGHDIVIDALFGSGVREGLPEWIRRWVDSETVVAAHVPSGLDPVTGIAASPVIEATTTVTFGGFAPGHLIGDGPRVCGRIVVADIGLGNGEPVMEVFTADDANLTRRSASAHKWSAGSVLVVGGSMGMVGAPVMAARSALAFGAGAVGLAVPEELSLPASILAPELLSYPPDDLPTRFDVVIAGPGMGSNREALDAVLAHGGPIVLDADALQPGISEAIAARTQMTILTPHSGELERLTGDTPTWENAQHYALETGSVVVLKGHPTFICSEMTPIAVRSGGPELATIGTGDVLAGMIGACVARGMDGVIGSAAAVYWHGIAAAELAATTTVTADRLIDQVGRFAGVT